MTRSIMFFIIETRLDIFFAILVVSRFTKNLGYQPTKAVKIIFCYLKSLKSWKITYNSQNKLLIERYFDSN